MSAPGHAPAGTVAWAPGNHRSFGQNRVPITGTRAGVHPSAVFDLLLLVGDTASTASLAGRLCSTATPTLGAALVLSISLTPRLERGMVTSSQYWATGGLARLRHRHSNSQTARSPRWSPAPCPPPRSFRPLAPHLPLHLGCSLPSAPLPQSPSARATNTNGCAVVALHGPLWAWVGYYLVGC